MNKASSRNTSKLFKEPFLSMGILAIVYFVGIVGILSPWQSYFLILTPLNLLLTITLVLRQEQKLKDLRFLAFCIIAWLTGYWVEVAGVKTGAIFGEYSYGPTLGIKILDVPLMIGVNWLLLTYCSGEVSRRFIGKSKILKVLTSAALMVALDFLLEPVAIQLDFWSWNGDLIPFQNYAAWFAVATFLAFIYHSLPYRAINQLGLFVFMLQLGFFLILNITL